MMTLTLNRRGDFKVEDLTGSDEFQCGIRGTRHYWFSASVTCPESALDERGFIVDQLDILKMFQTRWATVRDLPSCELLAIEAVRAVREMAPYATRVCVELSTAPINGDDMNAPGMKATWQRARRRRQVNRARNVERPAREA